VIVDTSAILAILEQEPDAGRYARALGREPACQISAANWLEASIVMFGRHREEGVRDLDLLLANYRVDVAEVTLEQAQEARRAFMRFGKGLHPARLNFGDCFAYGLAKDTGEKLLFKGGDFDKMDIEPAPY
jgi:ribonuclease VapC